MERNKKGYLFDMKRGIIYTQDIKTSFIGCDSKVGYANVGCVEVKLGKNI